MEEIRHTVCDTHYFRRVDSEYWIVGDRDFDGFPYSHLSCCECRTRPFGCSEEIRRHCGHGPPLGRFGSDDDIAIAGYHAPCWKESYIVWNSLGCTWASTACKPWITMNVGKNFFSFTGCRTCVVRQAFGPMFQNPL